VSDIPRRRLRPLIAFYAAASAVWLAFAHWAVPPIIAAAYHGRGPEPLNRFFRGRQPHPLAHYFHLWDDFAAAVLIAWALHLAFVLLVRRLDRRVEEGRGTVRASRWLVGVAAAFLAVTLLSGPRHDYVADLEIWSVVLRGSDPWWIIPEKGVPLHAYGPLFNALALPAALSPLLPKLLFAFAYLATVAWLVKGVGPRRGLAGLPRAGRIAWLANPYVWVEIAYFGHWDILAAVACVAAVHERSRGRDIAAGSWLAAGILLKYLPAVILPFLVVEGRRVRWKLLFAAMLVTAAGLALSWLVWGESTFRAITYGAARPSTLLSVFRFLRGTYSPLRLAFEAPNVDAFATPCLALAGLAVFAWYRARRVGPAAGSLLGVLATLLFYRVGFPQYQIVALMLASYWVVAERRPGRDPFLAPALGLYFGWLALFDVFYALVGGVLHPGDRFAWVEEVVGLPTFLLGTALLVAIAREARRESTGIPPP
jgi:hypothetical protein